METEFARLLLIYENDFATFYKMMTAKDYFDHGIDVSMKYDMITMTKIVDMNFDIMATQREAFMATFNFVTEHCNANLSNLVIEGRRNTPIISIHLTRELYEPRF